MKFKRNLEEKEYEIIFDEKDLEDLKRELIDNSLIVHHTYVGRYNSEIDFSQVENYKATLVKRDESGDIIKFEYDKHVYPNLVNYIDLLQKGNDDAFKKIYNPVLKEEYLPLLNEVSSLSNELFNLEKINESDEIKNKIIEEILLLLIKYTDGKYISNIKNYYEDAKGLFELREVDKPKALSKMK